MKLFKKRLSMTQRVKNLVESFNTSYKNLVVDLNDRFNAISNDYDGLFGKVDQLSQHFYELRDELATNGVVRDLRKAEKEIVTLREQLSALAAFTTSEFNRLGHNGMATAINKLNAEVFRDKKTDGSTIGALIAHLSGSEQSEDVTLAGKVDAIIEYLGIDVTVKPKEVTPAKIVTKKVKTQKKGRK